MPGVDVHGADDGRIIVTVEDTEDATAADTMMTFNDVDGVINTVLVYHYGGDERMEEEVS